jgi:hypothetical protein
MDEEDVLLKKANGLNGGSLGELFFHHFGAAPGSAVRAF